MNWRWNSQSVTASLPWSFYICCLYAGEAWLSSDHTQLVPISARVNGFILISDYILNFRIKDSSDFPCHVASSLWLRDEHWQHDPLLLPVIKFFERHLSVYVIFFVLSFILQDIELGTWRMCTLCTSCWGRSPTEFYMLSDTMHVGQILKINDCRGCYSLILSYLYF